MRYICMYTHTHIKISTTDVGRKILSKTPTYFKYCSSSLLSSTIISMLQHNRWLSFIECKINEIWRWSCLQKQTGHPKKKKKKVHLLIYRTETNKLPSGWLSILSAFLNVFKQAKLIHLRTVQNTCTSRNRSHYYGLYKKGEERQRLPTFLAR